MKMNLLLKRSLAVLTAALLAASLLAAPALAAGGAVRVAGASGRPGENVTVTITTQGVGPVRSGAVELSYDDTLLTPVSAAGAAGLQGAMDISGVTDLSQVAGVRSMYSWNAAGGVVKIAFACGADIGADQAAFTVTFRIRSGVPAGSSALTARVSMGRERDGDTLSNASASGSITIIGGGGTAPTVEIPDRNGAIVRGDFEGLYVRVALVLESSSGSGLYVTQGEIAADGTVAFPNFSMPGLTVKGINVALVSSLSDITSRTPNVVATATRML